MPASQWKGKGKYYKRGKRTWTKYSEARDKAKGGRVGTGDWKHTHDRTVRAKSKRVRHVKHRKKR
jgi:hypothetical protein